MPQVKNIRFENVQALKPIEQFLCVGTPVENVVTKGGNVENTVYG